MSALRRIVAYIAPKLAQFLFVVLATYTVVFLLVTFLPGDPLVAALASKTGGDTIADPETLERMREQYGLAGTPWEQYWHRLGMLLQGDLGVSIGTGQPVADMIARTAPNSIEIAALALVLAVVFAVLITFLAFLAPNRWIRNVLLQIPPFGVAIPAFLTGLLLISVFSFRLGWFPSSGSRLPGSSVLPAVTLALPVGAILFQVFSAAVLEAQTNQHVFTAVAKGVPPRRIFTAHLLRNALLPSITMLGLSIGYLAAGTAVVETVFSRDGIGRMTVNAVLARDINVIQGIVLMIAAVYALVNLLVDLAYGVIDPRTRRGGRASRGAGRVAAAVATGAAGPATQATEVKP